MHSGGKLFVHGKGSVLFDVEDGPVFLMVHLVVYFLSDGATVICSQIRDGGIIDDMKMAKLLNQRNIGEEVFDGGADNWRKGADGGIGDYHAKI